jgi:hypothetical protein
MDPNLENQRQASAARRERAFGLLTGVTCVAVGQRAL